MIAGCSVETTSGSSECHPSSSLFGNDPKLHDPPGMSGNRISLMTCITDIKMMIVDGKSDEKCSYYYHGKHAFNNMWILSTFCVNVCCLSLFVCLVSLLSSFESVRMGFPVYFLFILFSTGAIHGQSDASPAKHFSTQG